MASIRDTFTSLSIISKFVGSVLPLVNTELEAWKSYAERSSPELRTQALASIRDKKFHCQGGSVYSLYPAVNSTHFVKLVVSLQTISDYLDNLCDRAGIADEAAFRQLHLSMSDALNPAAGLKDYYMYYPYKNDGGYLAGLVTACQQAVSQLPAYNVVKAETLKLAALYSDLQTYKHLSTDSRESKMQYWIGQHIHSYPDITPWEFAAASGSTLGIFALCAAAANASLSTDTAAKILTAYFPWICGLHIQLDYLIDRSEDKAAGDLNFVSYYADEQQILERISFLGQQALKQTAAIPHPVFTYTVINGLYAMYLSDPKADSTGERELRNRLLSATGRYTTTIYHLCRFLRKSKSLQ